jgi:molecular chaperone DnaK
MSKVIGTDLGTRSCVAIMEEACCYSQRGRKPYAVHGAFTDGERPVGQQQNARRSQSGEHLFSIKRLIGRKFDTDAVKGYRDFPFKIVKADGDLGGREGKQYSPRKSLPVCRR